MPSRPSKIPEIRLCFALFWCFSFFLVIKQLFWESLVSLRHDSLYQTTEDTTIIYKTLRKKNLEWSAPETKDRDQNSSEENLESKSHR